MQNRTAEQLWPIVMDEAVKKYKMERGTISSYSLKLPDGPDPAGERWIDKDKAAKMSGREASSGLSALHPHLSFNSTCGEVSVVLTFSLDASLNMQVSLSTPLCRSSTLKPSGLLRPSGHPM